MKMVKISAETVLIDRTSSAPVLESIYNYGAILKDTELVSLTDHSANHSLYKMLIKYSNF